MNGSVSYEGLILEGAINVNAGANLEELTATSNGVYLPSTGKEGFSKVTVNVPAPVIDDITITSNGQYTPPSGVVGYDDITVNVPVPVLDDITITSNGHYTPPSGVNGYDDITVNVPAPAINFNLNNKKIASTGGVYITTPFDIDIVANEDYIISINDVDNSTIYTSTFKYNGSNQNLVFSGFGTVSFNATTIGLSEYSGDYRNIYAKVSPIDTRQIYT